MSTPPTPNPPPPMHNLGSFFASNLPQLGQLGQVALQAAQLGVHVSPQAQSIAALLILLSQLHAAPANAAPEQIPTVTGDQMAKSVAPPPSGVGTVTFAPPPTTTP